MNIHTVPLWQGDEAKQAVSAIIGQQLKMKSGLQLLKIWLCWMELNKTKKIIHGSQSWTFEFLSWPTRRMKGGITKTTKL